MTTQGAQPYAAKEGEDQPLEPDPVIEAYKRDVDRTLLRENLRLTVDERFRKHAALQRFAAELHRAGRLARGK
jgi:hypothetical protein